MDGSEFRESARICRWQPRGGMQMWGLKSKESKVRGVVITWKRFEAQASNLELVQN